MKICLHHPCSTIKMAETNEEKNCILSPGFSFRYYERIQEVPADYWQLAESSGDIFLQRNYLQLLYESPPANMGMAYLLFQQNNRPVGIAFCQYLKFKASEHLRQQEDTALNLKNLLRPFLNYDLLICGNMLLSGQHGFYFQFEDDRLACKLLNEALRKTAASFQEKGGKIDGILLKDIPNKQETAIRSWSDAGYEQLVFQPNMVLSIAPHWQHMNDYLDALTSKYRVRYRRARKKLAPVRTLKLNHRQIQLYEKELYRLYRKIADNSEFCMTYLPSDYFTSLKKYAPEAFQIWGYFLEEQLIGFCTALQNGPSLEAHFLGLDPSFNPNHQLYLNMLYDLIHYGIEKGSKKLVFSRTALEIKSSVGAKPAPLSIFLAHHSRPVLGRILPHVVRFLEPKTDWKERNPFKEEIDMGV